jgi:polysaccharide pyruvyl transferase WcaK-like protein
MQKAEFLIGMRMHATILGACANLPIIALYYQTKGKSFFESLSIENYAIPIEEFEFPEIQSIIRNLILDRDKLKNKIRDVMVDLRELARLNVNTIMKYINSNE